MKALSRFVAAFVVATFLFVAPSAAQNSFVGSWASAPATAGVSGFVELDIKTDDNGEYQLVFSGPTKAPLGMRPFKGALKDDVLSGQIMALSHIDGYLANPVTLAVRPAGDAPALDATLTDAVGKVVSLRFLPADDAQFAQFKTPRIDENGEPVRNYVYKAPSAEETGLPVSTLRREKFDTGLMAKAVEYYLSGEARNGAYLIVMRNGKLVMEEYFYGANRDRLWVQHSVSKSLTSLLTGVAVKDDGLDLDAPINSLFPEHAETSFMRSSKDKGVTPRQMLRMANIVGWGDGSKANGGDYTNPAGRFVSAVLTGDWLSAYFSYPVITSEPDAYYNYNTLTTHALGAVIERKTGVHLSTYLQDKLMAPLGETRSVFASSPLEAGAANENSPALAGSFAAVRPLSMAKVGQLLLNRGAWNGEQVIDEDWIVESTSVKALHPDLDGPGYGYKWWHLKLQDQKTGEPFWVVYADGYGGQNIFVVPRYNLVVANGALAFSGGFSTEKLLGEFIIPAVARRGAKIAPADITADDLNTAPLSR